MGPGGYGSIGSKIKDLLTGDLSFYDRSKYDQKVSLDTKTADGVSFAVSGLRNGQAITSSIETKFNAYGSNAVIKVNSDGKVEPSLTFKNLLDGVIGDKDTFSLKLSNSNANFTPNFNSIKAEADYGTKLFNLKTSANFDEKSTNQPLIIDSSIGLGADGVLVGAEVSLDTGAGELKKLNLAGQYTDSDFIIGGKFESTSSGNKTVKASYVHLIGKDKCGGEIVHNLSQGDTSAVVGYSHSLGGGTSAKLRVDSKGTCTLGYKTPVSEGINLNLSTQFNALAIDDGAKFGVAFGVK